jgi:phage terminase small subunit
MYKPKQTKVILKKGEPKKEYKLTRKQKIFADKYIETGNGTKSALEAYNTTDYDSANTIARENLQKPPIKAYLEDK